MKKIKNQLNGMKKNYKNLEIILEKLFWIISIFFYTRIVVYADSTSDALKNLETTLSGKTVSSDKNTGIVIDMIKAIIKDFPITAAFYDVMCWLCLFITAALGIKQLFVKSDEDRGGGFWNVLKVAGWGIAGLLGIIVKNTIK